MAKRRRKRALPVIGWREWVAFPDLTIERIKAKVDTGARSSALHATDLRTVTEDGIEMVVFRVQPVQRRRLPIIEARAELVDERYVRSSSGRRELRPVVETDLQIAGQRWAVDLTLTNRDVMGFRLLLGRQAVRGRFVVDPGRSFRVSAR